MFDFVSGDTGSALQVTCIDNATGQPLPLAGATVRLKWPGQMRTMTMVNPALGIVSYQFATGELVPGSMAFEVEVTDAQGRVIRSLDLVTTHVRQAL